tara:strand:+ start:743 stop:955 length:213 start_codon:yes stop_codon:yes gene_type:complete
MKGMQLMRIYQMFEEDTANLLSIARWAMEQHPDEVKEALGLSHEYYVKLLVLGASLEKEYNQEEVGDERH